MNKTLKMIKIDKKPKLIKWKDMIGSYSLKEVFEFQKTYSNQKGIYPNQLLFSVSEKAIKRLCETKPTK